MKIQIEHKADGYHVSFSNDSVGSKKSAVFRHLTDALSYVRGFFLMDEGK